MSGRLILTILIQEGVIELSATLLQPGFCCCFSWAIPGVLLNAAGVNRSFYYVAKGIISVRKQQMSVRSQLCARVNTRSGQQSGEQSRRTLFGFGIQ